MICEDCKDGRITPARNQAGAQLNGHDLCPRPGKESCECLAQNHAKLCNRPQDPLGG